MSRFRGDQLIRPFLFVPGEVQARSTNKRPPISLGMNGSFALKPE